MALVLETYDAVAVPEKNGVVKFFIPMTDARDIVLADLATELNAFNGLMFYEHNQYNAIDGVQKHMNEHTGHWNAVVAGVLI